MEIRKAKQNDINNIKVTGLFVWLDTYAFDGVTDAMSDYVISEFS